MIVIAPQRLQKRVTLPPSKSISNRALVMNALCGAGMLVSNVSDCDDSRVVVDALQRMPRVIDVKAAGTAMRFMTSVLAVHEGEHVITGTERMCNRPIAVLVDALRSLGADIRYEVKEGFPPLRISGQRLRGGRLSLPSNVSSQYISSLLMIGPTLTEGLTLELVGDIISKPYIEMTMHMMREFGARVDWASDRVIRVESGGYAPIEYQVEADWSAASYWYEMVALSDDKEAHIQLPGLFANSVQGDAEVARIFSHLGVETSMEDGVIHLRKGGGRVDTLEWDMVEQPDLAQTIVVTCCMLGVPFRLSGLQTLRIKETDRIAALQCELLKLGFALSVEGDDALSWDGEMSETKDQLVCIDTYEDHRMAMSFAPVAMVRGRIEINNPEVVSKSYPSFWDDVAEAGFILE